MYMHEGLCLHNLENLNGEYTQKQDHNGENIMITTWTESQPSTVILRRVCQPARTTSSPDWERSQHSNNYWERSQNSNNYWERSQHSNNSFTSVVLFRAFLLWRHQFPFLGHFDHSSRIHETKPKSMTEKRIIMKVHA